MRILHITPDYFPSMGGGELYIKEISERLAARGHDVSVLAMNSRGVSGRDGRALPPSEVLNGVKVTRLNRTYKLHERLLGLRGAHRALGLALDREVLSMLSLSPCSPRTFLLTLRAHADVVGVINWYHGSLAYQTAIARDRREFAFVGIPLFHTERPWAHAPLATRTLERCDAVAVMTEHERRFVQSCSSQVNAHVVGAGVDPAHFARADRELIRTRHGIGEAPLVGYVGRMSPSKGVVTLIQAMRAVWQRDPAVRLLLAGTGLPGTPTCDRDVAAEFDSLDSAERQRVVAIGGFTDDEKASIFAALDVFAMTSVAESFGIAYLEAWMGKAAVIGASIGSTACVISDGVDGRLVPPGEPVPLAKCILQMVADPVARARMGRAGHAKSLTSFTWEGVTRRVEAVYELARETRKTGRKTAGAVA